MALTKSHSSIDEWAIIEPSTVRTGATITLTGAYNASLSVQLVYAENGVAHANGGLVVIEVKYGSGDDDWHELTSFRGTAGTANAQSLDDSAASGQKVVPLGLTTNFEALFDKYWLKDTTIADSEIVRNNGFVDDVSITVLDDLAHAHVSGEGLYDIVDQWVIALPDSVQYARVLTHNDDADGPDLASATQLAEITAL